MTDHDKQLIEILMTKRGNISIEESNIIFTLYKTYVNTNYHRCGCSGEEIRLWGDLTQWYKNDYKQ